MMLDGCAWRTLKDVDRADFEKWIGALREAGTGARALNVRLVAGKAFCNWLVQVNRLAQNPLKGIEPANEKADRRHERRALTLDELAALIHAAERRPLDGALRNRGGNPADLKADERSALEAKGRERALVYRVLAFTGLRYGELRSVTVGQVALDATPPHIVLRAADEKARRGALIPLRADLVDAIRHFLRAKSVQAKKAALRTGKPAPLALSPDTRLFDLPLSLKKPLALDLVAAGLASQDKETKRINKRDQHGRVIDVHCLRHTYATMLAKAGLPLQQAQRLMRHSDPKLTASVYTHLGVLDGAAAVAKLPALPDAKPEACEKTVRAMQIESGVSAVPPPVPPTHGNDGSSQSISGKRRVDTEYKGLMEQTRGMANVCKGVQRESEIDKWWAARDSNPRPPACKADALTS